MPGFIITEDAKLACPHGSGSARALMPDAHVSISGKAIMTVQRQYVIETCSNTNAPCVTATWVSGAQRVTAGGLAVAINTGQSKVDPVGMLAPLQFQSTVTAS
jgi:hypothetical protein